MADEERPFDGVLLPCAVIVVKSVYLSCGGDGENGVNGRKIALQDGEVEFGVAADRHWLDVEGFGFVIGDLDLV